MITMPGPGRFAYFCLMRPPMPGAVPRDGMVQVDAREGKSETTGHHYWGRVVYDHKLSDYEVRHYDLEPTLYVNN